MKRIAIILSVLCIALSGRAQTDTLTAPNCRHFEFKIDLGISAGITLYNSGNNHSPYYSNYGTTVQLPIMARWQFSPNWQFSTGLRYDFTWNRLYHNVEPSGSWDDYSNMGLQFLQTPTTVKQNAYAYISHLGIPVEMKWYPFARHKNSLALALDFFAGYAVSRYFNIENNPTPGIWEEIPDFTVLRSSAIQPWKLEVGFSITTDLIGLSHGVRLFTNLLPTYIDPLTNEKTHTFGITLFL
jgi:hypothetical protein